MIDTTLTRGLGWLVAGTLALGWLLGAGVTPSQAQDVIVDRDVVYYDGPDFYAPRHVLDIYRLDDGVERPVLMFIHGGAWTGGNKNTYGYLGNFFARQGYVTVIANYRLTDNSPGRVMHPGHIADVAAAFTWTYYTIPDYGGNREKIFLSGHSAGGHLVSLLATDPRYLADYGLSPDDIAGVMSLSGVYDVRTANFANVFGNAAQRADASPVMHVGDGPPPPFQVLYAENDLGNLGFQAVVFWYLLADLPAEAELIEFAGRNHGTIISRIDQPGDEVAEAMLQFMAKH